MEFLNFITEVAFRLDERKDDKRRREIASNIFNHLVDNFHNAKKTIMFDGDEIHFQFPEEIYSLKIVFLNYPPGKVKQKAAYVKKINGILINGLNEDIYSDVKEGRFKEAFIKSESLVIHELIHYMDYFRWSLEYGNHTAGAPLNSPPEFEAYFQQLASIYDKQVNVIKTKPDPLENFYKIFGDTVHEFLDKNWNNIKENQSELFDAINKNRDYKWKWNKRCFQLYYELRDDITKNLKNYGNNRRPQ